VGAGEALKTSPTPIPPTIRHCDVCYLLDGDTSPKHTLYCRLCDKYMCDRCRKNNWRRTAAAIAFHMRTLLNKVQGGQNESVT
jgi:hypothetical protein